MFKHAAFPPLARNTRRKNDHINNNFRNAKIGDNGDNGDNNDNNDNNQKPLFCQGEEKDELWGFILEKSFAKAHGCYQNLMHGETCEALRDMTGGLVEKLQWQLVAAGGLAAGHGATSAPSQAASQQQNQSSPAAVEFAPIKAGGAEAAGTRSWSGNGEGAGGLHPRVAGWGMSAGTTPPSGWVLESIRDKLADGQVIGCR